MKCNINGGVVILCDVNEASCAHVSWITFHNFPIYPSNFLPNFCFMKNINTRYFIYNSNFSYTFHKLCKIIYDPYVMNILLIIYVINQTYQHPQDASSAFLFLSNIAFQLTNYFLAVRFNVKAPVTFDTVAGIEDTKGRQL